MAEGLALVPEGRRLFTAMTVRENLLVARAAGRRGLWSFDTVLDAFPQLVPKLDARAGEIELRQHLPDGLMQRERVRVVRKGVEKQRECGLRIGFHREMT